MLVVILCRPRGGTPAVTFIVTLVSLPISRPGKWEGRMIGLRAWLLQPGVKLIALLLTLCITRTVRGVTWYLAQCRVVGGLPLGELKPFRFRINGHCSDYGRVRCIRVLQTVELLRGRQSFTMLLIMCVDPEKP